MTNDLDIAWQSFMNEGTFSYNIRDSKEQNDKDININNTANLNEDSKIYNTDTIPKSSDIYISTKTKIAYLNKPIDLKNVFWEIPVIDYGNATEGVVKKQMKFNSTTKEDVEVIEKKMSSHTFSNCDIIQQIDNPNGRIKFKDIRKVNIGICRKDMLSYRTKQKSAFYNCFVLIFRTNINKNNDKEAVYKEYHLKVFNTGKLEIPGIRDDKELYSLLDLLVNLLNDIVTEHIVYDGSKSETVLINSNFNSNYYINRDKLFQIMKYKYKIQSVFDPCSYPGIQSKIFFDENGVYPEPTDDNKKNSISFMIFRTGSVLIVGKCEEKTLFEVYNYIKTVLYDEYNNINDDSIDISIIKKPANKSKVFKKKKIIVDLENVNVEL